MTSQCGVTQLTLKSGLHGLHRTAQRPLALSISGTFRQTEQVVRLLAVILGFQVLMAGGRARDDDPDALVVGAHPELVLALLDASDGVIERELPARVIAIEPTDVLDALMRIHPIRFIDASDLEREGSGSD